MTHTPNLKVAIAGLGAVCLPVAKWLDQGVPGFDLVAVSAGNKARAAEKIKDFKNPPPIVDLDELVSMGDIIVEGLPPERYFDLAVPAIEQGKILTREFLARGGTRCPFACCPRRLSTASPRAR